MTKCPICAEEIQHEALKCHHCGEVLDPEALPPGRSRAVAEILAFPRRFVGLNLCEALLAPTEEQMALPQMKQAAQDLLILFDETFPAPETALMGVSSSAKSMRREDRHGLIIEVARRGYRRAILCAHEGRAGGFDPFVSIGELLLAIEDLGLSNAWSTILQDIKRLERSAKVKVFSEAFALVTPQEINDPAHRIGSHAARAFHAEVKAARARYQKSSRRREPTIPNDRTVRVHFRDLDRLMDLMGDQRLCDPKPKPPQGLRLLPDEDLTGLRLLPDEDTP